MQDEQGLAAMALTSRLVESTAKPLSAREFWALRRRIEPSSLLGMAASEIAMELAVGAADSERIATLVDRGAGLAIALERMSHSGMSDPDLFRRPLSRTSEPPARRQRTGRCTASVIQICWQSTASVWSARATSHTKVRGCRRDRLHRS